jgi:hypothetical protein
VRGPKHDFLFESAEPPSNEGGRKRYGGHIRANNPKFGRLVGLLLIINPDIDPAFTLPSVW